MIRKGSGLCPRCGGTGTVDGIPCGVCSTVSRAAPDREITIGDFESTANTDPFDFVTEAVSVDTAADKRAANILRRDAGHVFDVDQLTIDVVRDVRHALETDGHGCITLVADTETLEKFERRTERTDAESTGFESVSIVGVEAYKTDSLRDGEAFAIGDTAIATPPATPPIVVRDPSGVAHIKA